MVIQSNKGKVLHLSLGKEMSLHYRTGVIKYKSLCGGFFGEKSTQEFTDSDCKHCNRMMNDNA